jgi:HTH-type transcriptional regulator, sugar sensing transcriptional regulator
VVVTREARRILATWPGEHLSIAVDADQFLIALLSKDTQSVHQAIWSNSTLLSCLQYNALHVELELTEINGRGDKHASTIESLSLTRLKPPGFQKLNERYGEAGAKAPSKRRRKP